jgi:ubiquitin carboxyl-terminal hydrolase 22/27/51
LRASKTRYVQIVASLTVHSSRGSQWCRFDDDKVTPATLAEVLGTSAPIYMAFYVKRRLDYKPHTTPSYILMRENEVVREREALAAKARAEQEQAREREREVEDELLATVGV